MTARAAPDDSTDIALGPSLDAAGAVAILVHGRDRSAAEMGGLARRIDAPAVRFVLPEAPGGTWYPEGFMAPIADNEPALSRSIAAYEERVAGIIAAGVRPENIIVAGFSQGGCLTAEFVVRHPRPYGAILIFTGGLIGPPGTEWPDAPALRGVPVYISGSTVDPWVPPERVEATARVLEGCGARVTLRIFGNREHHICDAEIAAAHDMLAWWQSNDGRRDRPEVRSARH